MSTFDHDRLQELFEGASELNGSEREAFLDRACAGDSGLRQRIDGLLAVDEKAVAGLDQPVVGSLQKALDHAIASASTGATGMQPKRIGEYEILGVLGSGGMGIVYEGQQESPRRRVALKVIRPGSFTPSMLRRFEHESLVLGWLNHPAIAQIYSAGIAESDGGPLPYIAMELVRGVPLTDYALREKLSTNDRLELLAKVADGVHHAHGKGVIHRDLKPSNILVTGDGSPKVLDFGVARVIGADAPLTTMHTAAGEVIGTLAYMSPEQVSGMREGVDARSDVYSLGALAHELLAGAPPFDLRGKLIHEAARIIVEDEPSTLGLHASDLRGDVETIVAKAVEKEPERRYATAHEFALDVRRFLRDEPVTARPPSAIYQLRKFAAATGRWSPESWESSPHCLSGPASQPGSTWRPS